MSDSWLAPESPDLVWFSGADAVRFLNDLISQEIGTAAAGSVRRSLLLASQGKLDHVLWVLRGEDLVGLVTDTGRGEELATTLGRYRIRVKVDIEVEERPLWVVVGEASPGTWTGERDSTLDADISWRTTPRKLVAGERPELSVGSPEEYEGVRILSGEPKWGVDIDEKTIPLEADLVAASVDFTKGCYLGQELVARIDSRGHVNRHLRILELSAPVEPGTEIVAGDKVVGTLTSAQNRVPLEYAATYGVDLAENAAALGLALVRREVSPGDTVTVGNISAVIHSLP